MLENLAGSALDRIRSEEGQMLTNPQTMMPTYGAGRARGEAFNALYDLFGGSDEDSTARAQATRRAEGLLSAGRLTADFTPGVGDVIAFGEAKQALDQGNLGQAAILGGLGMLGMIPVAGDVASRALRGTRSIGTSPLEGAPIVANVPNVGRVELGKNPDAEAAAQRASEVTGVPYQPTTRYDPVDENRARRIAREYDLMRHSPEDPSVQRAYDQMTKETLAQYDAMLEQGIEPFFINPAANPYPNSPYEVLLDIAENRRLGVFPSVEGFGTNPNFNPAGNPLLQPSGRTIGGQPALMNDIFRAVHDYYGHSKPGVGFRAAGEEAAYQSHAGMYSPLARRALASETRGQNSFLNYGPFGESNRAAKIDDTIFADQKSGLMPRWASEEGLLINENRRREFFDNLGGNRTGLEGAITDDGKLRLVHYSGRPLERIDPEFYGSGLSRGSIAERNRASDSDFVKRSYYGVPALEDAYRPELGLGAVRNEILIEPELIYQAQRNPDGLWVANDPTGSERRIADAGYTGYYTNHPKLKKVAVIFDPYDVSKTYMIPVGAVGAGALATKGAEEEDQQEFAQGGEASSAKIMLDRLTSASANKTH
jgi:hypothetical protein